MGLHDSLHSMLSELDDATREHLREVLIRDQADRDAISRA
jgi:hypothetical protein